MSRILIVDDHPLYRQGLRRFIEAQPGLVCCGETDSCKAAMLAASQTNPDLVILDLCLRREDGLELLKNLHGRFPTVRVLVLSQKDESAYAEPALRAGAQGYIMKEEATEELLTALSSRLSCRALEDDCGQGRSVIGNFRRGFDHETFSSRLS